MDDEQRAEDDEAIAVIGGGSKAVSAEEDVEQKVKSGFNVKRKFEIMTEQEARHPPPIGFGRRPRAAFKVPTMTLPRLEGVTNVLVYLLPLEPGRVPIRTGTAYTNFETAHSKKKMKNTDQVTLNQGNRFMSAADADRMKVSGETCLYVGNNAVLRPYSAVKALVDRTAGEDDGAESVSSVIAQAAPQVHAVPKMMPAPQGIPARRSGRGQSAPGARLRRHTPPLRSPVGPQAAADPPEAQMLTEESLNAIDRASAYGAQMWGPAPPASVAGSARVAAPSMEQNSVSLP